MTILTEYAGVIAATPSQAPTITLLGSSADDVNRTSYTFGPFTAPRDGRIVILTGVRAKNSVNTSITGATIGGTAARRDTTAAASNQASSAQIFSLPVTAGSYSVVVNLDVEAASAGAFAFLLEGASSVQPTAPAEDTSYTASGTTRTVALTGAGALFEVASVSTDTDLSTSSFAAEALLQAGTEANRFLAATGIVNLTGHIETVTANASTSIAVGAVIYGAA